MLTLLTDKTKSTPLPCPCPALAFTVSELTVEGAQVPTGDNERQSQGGKREQKGE